MSRPRVVVYQGASVDGRLTVAPDVLLLFGDERWKLVTGSVCVTDQSDEIYQWLTATHRPQVILQGSGSFVTSRGEPDPLPPPSADPDWLCQDFLPETVLDRLGDRRWFAVVDSQGRIRWGYKETEDELLLVLVARHTPLEYLAYLQREDIPYLVAGEERVDLRLALESLHSQLGVECVISTAGGKLNGALLRAGLVDEINIVFFPAVIGGVETPSLFDSPRLETDQLPTRLRLISSQVHSDGRVWLRYQVIPD